MAALTRFGFLATAIIFHLIYVLSIFDIYFVSPIVSGMRLFGVDRASAEKAPADRLVLFVGDGLRADKTFQWHPEPYPKNEEDLVPRPLAPFLRSQVLNQATFGVSHTRVPTESRPGHVALIAGLYEDVSAVATGWKLNPVDFDSVFNRSRHTWSWGSPDILPMFEKGAIPGKVDAYMYDAEFEDFSQDALHLDYWVFDHVKDLFAEAATNAELDKALRQDKIVFFLHLLGLDTTGHFFRPYSPEYLYNLKVVDHGVQEVTNLINSFYNDDRTAFVFTADHGMSDWGSHGDGNPDNTRTPLIAWGSGVAKPKLHTNSRAPGHDEFSADWALDSIERHDVAQADVAALMAFLLGVEFPANSVGELPLPYLSADQREKAKALLVNAQGILEMYLVKEEKKAASQLRFKPYGPLSTEGLGPAERISAVRQLIDRGHYDEAVEEIKILINVALQGLRYLQTYDWLFLRTLVTIGYLGWMAYAITIVVDAFVVKKRIPPQRTLSGIMLLSSLLVAFYASFIISKSPWTYYVYAFFPVVFWGEVIARRAGLAQGGRELFDQINSISAIITFIFDVVAYVTVIILLALGYIHRHIFTYLYIAGAIWPAAYGLSFIRANPLLVLGWVASCMTMSTFTLLPAMKIEDVDLMTCGGVIMVIFGLLYLALADKIFPAFSWSGNTGKDPHMPVGKILVGIQVGLVALSTIVTRSSSISLQGKQGLPLGNQVVGWITLVVSLLMPFMYRLDANRHYAHRLMALFLAGAPTFVILTVSYEGLFYLSFSVTLMIWVQLEYSIFHFQETVTKNEQTKNPTARDSTHIRPLRLCDARVALFFFMLLQSAFFSTGNIASVSAFSLDTVTRLIPVFDPFSQGAMLILKLMIPYALISANLGVLNKRLGVAPSALFMLVMAVSDILTLYFFWVVKDEGSWLEIGSTISHFVIASALCVFLAALESVSLTFISGVIVDGHVAVSGFKPEPAGKPSPKMASAVVKAGEHRSVKK